MIDSNETKCSFKLDRRIDGVEAQQIWVGLRPEKISISKTPPENYNASQPVNTIVGKVKDIAYMGGLSTYHVESATGKRITATDFNVERNADHPTWEDTVYLTWEPENIMVLYS